MLKQKYRLKKKYQFNYVYRVGKSCHGKYSMIVFSPSKNQNVKIGISVSKKVGNSVKRNRARRLLREAVSPYLDSLKKNFNLIIVAKQAIDGKKLQDVRSDLTETFLKAELISKWKNFLNF